MKFIILCFIFALVYGNDDLRQIDSIRSERPCNQEGGICTIADDCPETKKAPLGLCPDQRSAGVECCYGVSKKETRCRKNGGECMEGCNPRLFIEQATDCPSGTQCCTLV